MRPAGMAENIDGLVIPLDLEIPVILTDPPVEDLRDLYFPFPKEKADG